MSKNTSVGQIAELRRAPSSHQPSQSSASAEVDIRNMYIHICVYVDIYIYIHMFIHCLLKVLKELGGERKLASLKVLKYNVKISVTFRIGLSEGVRVNVNP